MAIQKVSSLHYEETSDGFSFNMMLSEEDPLYHKKKKLLHGKGFGTEETLLLSASDSPHLTLKVMLEVARVVYLDEAELYFGGVNVSPPIEFYTPKNELSSLNSILSLIDVSIKSAKHDRVELLSALHDATIDMIKAFGDNNGEETRIEKPPSHTEELLLRWGETHGVRRKLQIAHVEGAGRGFVAIEDLKIGDVALEIPESIVICEELVCDSYMIHILKEIDGISTETMMLLWSMKERYNLDSKFKIYFETLPATFNSGLNFGIEALIALEGTLLFEEIVQAKEHLREQYDLLCPALCCSHPDVFQPELYTWECFLWACELWYSNSLKIILTDGKLKTCLVPIAGLFNHSLCPHITKYGRMDPATKSLKFSLSRQCREGEQCFLSYGNFSSSHLITFYGFLPKGNNLYDTIQLDIDVPEVDSRDSPELDWTAHMVRGTWFSSNHDIFYYGLPPSLLDYLRATLSDPKMLTVNTEIETAVLETLCSIFNPMIEELGDVETIDREDLSWDVKLALEYRNLQRKIVSSVLASCSTGLQMLQRLESKGT